VLFDGPVLELLTDAQLSLHPGLRRLGDDLIDADLDVDRAVRDLRAAHPATTAGEALLDQRLVAGSATSGSPRRCGPVACTRGPGSGSSTTTRCGAW
jgi:hypothetical protein